MSVLSRLSTPLGVALVALALRALHFITGTADEELFTGLFLDSLAYAEGGPGPDSPYLLSPLYPYLLAPFDLDPAGRALSVRAIQLTLGVFSCALVAGAVEASAGRRAGWIAGLLLAVCGASIHHEAQVLPGGPQGFLMAAALALAVRCERRGTQAEWVGVGILLGLAAALRPTALLAGAALGIGHLVARLRGNPTAGSRAGWLVTGILVAIAPFTARNALVSGEPVLLSASGGFNFWIGNHEGARGTFSPPPGYDFTQDPVGRGLAEAAAGRELSHVEASRFWRERALDDLAADPSAGLGRLLRKLGLLIQPVEIPQLGTSFEDSAERSLALRSPVNASWLVLLALAWPLFGRKDDNQVGRIAALLALGYLIAVVLFFVTGRLRAPALPLLAAMGGLGLDAALTSWQDRGARSRSLVATLSLILLATGSIFLPSPPGSGSLELAEASRARQRAVELLRAGRTDEAIASLRDALEEHGENDTTRTTLAYALVEGGYVEQAEPELRTVLSHGFSPRAAFELANIVAAPGPESGDAELRAGYEEAEGLYRAALAVQPRYADARFNLGVVLMRQGRASEARSEIETALEHGAPDVRWREDASRALELLAD